MRPIFNTQVQVENFFKKNWYIFHFFDTLHLCYLSQENNIPFKFSSEKDKSHLNTCFSIFFESLFGRALCIICRNSFCFNFPSGCFSMKALKVSVTCCSVSPLELERAWTSSGRRTGDPLLFPITTLQCFVVMWEATISVQTECEVSDKTDSSRAVNKHTERATENTDSRIY